MQPQHATRSAALAIAAALITTSSSAAQTQELDKLRAKTTKQITKTLVAFGRRAESTKMPSLAREAYRQILAHYDNDNNTARKGLGYRRQNGAWQRVKAEGSLADDTADDRQRSSIEKVWKTTRQRVAKMHRTLAVALRDAGHGELAREQFARILFYLPQDRESHVALGHASVGDYYGSEVEVAFARKMLAMLEQAAEIAEREYDIEPLPVDKMPAALRATGLPFVGARSKHFTYWVIESLEDAENSLTWAERSYDMLGELLGSKRRFRRPDNMRWTALVRTDAQREVVFAKSPQTTGEYSVDQARLFAGSVFQVRGGNAGIYIHERSQDADHAVAHVTKMHFLGGRNAGLGEGLVHAMTWMMCGSTLTFYASLPKTVSGKFELPRNDPEAWRERLEDEIRTGQDMPLVQIPRERYDNFRESTRVKSWSFMVFLLARHPNRWYGLVDGLSKKDLMPEQVAEIFAEQLDCTLEEVEAEWRAWCRPGSALGKASGW